MNSFCIALVASMFYPDPQPQTGCHFCTHEACSETTYCPACAQNCGHYSSDVSVYYLTWIPATSGGYLPASKSQLCYTSYACEPNTTTCLNPVEGGTTGRTCQVDWPTGIDVKVDGCHEVTPCS